MSQITKATPTVNVSKAQQNLPESLGRKTLRKCWLNWAMHNITVASYDRMEGHGFVKSLMPAVEKLYPGDKEKQAEILLPHTAYFNTEPQLGAMIPGIVIGMEEQRARGEPVDANTVQSVKNSLMGPLAGIGDSSIQGTLIPVLLSIAISLSQGGSILGPLFYIIVFNVLIVSLSYRVFHSGYRLGVKAVDLFVSENANKLRECMSIIGVTVIGGIASSYITLTTPLTFNSGKVNINAQNILDGIFPHLLPLLAVLGVWLLLTRYRLSVVKTMLVTLAVSGVGAFIGFF
ncbi:PTS system, fructose(Mannose)-specific IID [Sodalis praecaptivus]|uniref:PTS system, fructose(Mannose)-specific IID n=1 Tax=Sodalis praecaptivus TaxID=1239307 RepID=W0I030_9GAMM|nr:PTS system mannose/fructose/sorbose family transporter subunit IID [Sodalis praecaptivus]AHF78127.1 PTS system, fructose(Mannose)-specific IID [Sodalis praecaptivus]